MAVNADRISYSNTWDIDQQIASSEVAIGSGDTALLSVPGNNQFPVYEVQFQPAGSTKWYQPGTSSTVNTLASAFTFYDYITAGVIHVVTTTAGRVRYYVYSDRMNY